MTPRIPYQTDLPIYAEKDRIVATLRRHQVFVLTGDTGCGKSTQLPLMCLEAGRGRKKKIGITQPRRIAASSLCRRVAGQLGGTPGHEVGFVTRFSRKVSQKSRIVYMTDGILLSEIHRDRLLRRYDTIVIDEAHERNLNIDIILGVLTQACASRKDLRVIVSSATINAQLFAAYFDEAPVIHVEGTNYPVDVWYAPSGNPLDEDCDDRGYVEAAVAAVRDICDGSSTGDILVFMPTVGDCMETVKHIQSCTPAGTSVLPLYSGLRTAQQNAVFAQSAARKIVVATNVAETSLTVPGICYVVDTGLARIKRYSANSRITGLGIEKISRASADQRKGRCGRVCAGTCIRLYDEQDYAHRVAYTPPEVLRCNLAGAILTLSYAGLGPFETFPFIETPERRRITDGYAMLRELRAVDDTNTLSSHGKKMARIPLDPQLSHMLLMAQSLGAVREVAIIAAALSIPDPLDVPPSMREQASRARRGFAHERSDFLAYVHCFDAYLQEAGPKASNSAKRAFCRRYCLSYTRMQQWDELHNQIQGILANHKIATDTAGPASYESLHKSIIAGLVSNVAKKDPKGFYRSAKGRTLWVHPGSYVYRTAAEWIVCQEIVETSRVFARRVACIEPAWIIEVAAHLCQRRVYDPHFVVETGDVRAYERTILFGLPLRDAHRVYYGSRDTARARSVFIRQALVQERAPGTHRFLAHNRNVRRRAGRIRAKLRLPPVHNEEQLLYDFYDARLPTPCASMRELTRFCRAGANEKRLYCSLDMLVDREELAQAQQYPDTLTVGSHTLSLAYTFDPQSARDGITVTLPADQQAYVNRAVFSWLVPAMWRQKVFHLLGALPKRLRRRFVPVSETAKKVAAHMRFDAEKDFTTAMCETISQLYDVSLHPGDFRHEAVPRHLQMHVKATQEGTGASCTHDAGDAGNTPHESDHTADYAALFARWGQKGCRFWQFGTIAEKVELAGKRGGVPLIGYPCLRPGEDTDTVDLVAVTDKDEAQRTHREGVIALEKIVLARELTWLHKDIRIDSRCALQCRGLWDCGALRDRVEELVIEHSLKIDNDIRTSEQFENQCARARNRIATQGHEASELLHTIASYMQAHIMTIDRMHARRTSMVYTRVAERVRTMLYAYRDEVFAPVMSWSKLREYPRYLTALGYAIPRAFDDPRKFRIKTDAMDGMQQLNETLRSRFVHCSYTLQERIRAFDMMVCEYVISLYAQQEVKTRFSVTEKKIRKEYEDLAALF
jgi:ATP-dependent helicase HrpA